MNSLPGGGAPPAVDARTQLLNNAFQKFQGGTGGLVAGAMKVPQGQTVNLGQQSNAMNKAVANAAQMLLTRTVTQHAMKAGPQLVSEHGAGEMGAGNGSPGNNFALQRLHQMVASGLLAGMPSNMKDPSAVWRNLSQSMSSNPEALKQFLTFLQTGVGGVHPQDQQAGPYIGTQ